jgi:hypothetical protein
MRKILRSVSFLAALALVFSISGATGASADSGSATRVYLIATGFLCGLDPAACPAVAMAANGDTIELTGEGTLSIHPKSVTGGGDFTHKDPDGAILGSGTWEATQLLTFNSYGADPALGLPPELDGGYAQLRVHLSPAAGGPGFDAVLKVDCDLGLSPPGHAEGVRLAVQGALNFNKKVSGFTVFIIP